MSWSSRSLLLAASILALSTSTAVAGRHLAPSADSTGTDTIPAPPPPPPPQAATLAQGDWMELYPGAPSALLPQGRMYCPVIYDPAGDRMVLYGGWNGSTGLGDLEALTLRPTRIWSPISATGTPPPPLYGHSVIYDPVRGRMVIFGGVAPGNFSNQVWALNLGPSPSWQLLTPSGLPPSRREGHQAVYDASRDRMLVFGGYDGSHRNEVWQLSFTPSLAWTKLAPSGTLPPPRSGGTAVYDPVGDRMVIFGGADATTYMSDTWALAFDGGPHWIPLPGGPGPRTLATSIYDPNAGGMWMFGGVVGNGGGYQDVWFLSLGATPAWSLSTPPGPAPTPRWGSGSLFDPVADRMVVFGGVDLSDWLNQVWELPLTPGSQWSQIQPTVPDVPGFRLAHSAFLDQARDRVLIFGGSDFTAVGTNDLWALPLATHNAWVRVTPNGAPPSPRFSQTAVYDSKRNRELFFGGFGDTYLDDLWELDLTGTETWAPIPVQGPPPAARDAAGAVYDLVADRLVVFGGWDGSVVRNDLWWLPLDGSPLTWHLELPAGAQIPGHAGFAYAYDPTRHSMWVIGGLLDINNVGSIDVWRLDLSTSPMTWIPVATFGTPPSARWGLRMVYDTSHDRLLVFGGVDLFQWYNDVWQLSLQGTPAWQQLTPFGQAPEQRVWAGVLLDPTRDWLIVDGGNDNVVLDDTWALELDHPTPAQSSLIESEPIEGGVRILWSAPGGTVADVQRRTASTDWQSVGSEAADGADRIVYEDRSVEAGARYGYRLQIGGLSYGETWVTIASPGLALAGFASNPSGSRPSISFRLAGVDPAHLEVIDPRGRLVFAREVGSLGVGDHTVEVTGSALRAGVYWIRLRQGSNMRQVKGIVLP